MNAAMRIGAGGSWAIGGAMPRREDAELLRAGAPFFADLPRPDHAHMVVIRSPLAHGHILSIDVSAAQAVPGFRLALTAADLRRNGPLPSLDRSEASLPAPLTVLADGRVRYAGEPVAAIVADTEAAARVAAASVRLSLDALPAVLAPAEALETSAPSLHGEAGNAVHTLEHRVGDPEAAFASAALVLEETFAFHRVSATPLEPRGAAAELDPETGRLTIAATTQVPGIARVALAELLDRDVDDILYEPLRLGGGFGLKEALYPEEVLVAVAASRLGRGVVWQESRSEHFVGAAHGRQGSARVRMALDGEGIVTALSVDGLSDIGAGYGFAGNSPGAAMGGMIRGPYRIPAFQARTRSVTTNKTPLNVYRGAGHPQAVFAMERMMDKAARTLGLDRTLIRRRNLIGKDAFPFDRGVSYPGAGRIVYDSGDYERCLGEAMAAIGADGFAARRDAFEAENPGCRLGLGLAMVVELTSTGPDETVELSVDAAGRVQVATAIVAIGQGIESALTQVLSAALGLDTDDIAVHCASSLLRHSGGGTFASRGTSVGGAAVADGAEKLKRAAIALGAELHPEAGAALDWAEGGLVGIPGRNAPLSLAELVAAAGSERLAVTGSFTVPASTFASACHAAVVSVDVETGVVDVLDYAVAHDCGRVLNPHGVDGQIIGGVMQGLGATLYEDLAYDAAGTPLVRGLLDYPLPVAANVPRFHLRHVETPSPLNPLGFKGAGEGGFTGAPAAIVGAIEDALRDQPVSLTDDGPYTPARVLTLLRDACRQNDNKPTPPLQSERS